MTAEAQMMETLDSPESPAAEPPLHGLNLDGILVRVAYRFPAVRHHDPAAVRVFFPLRGHFALRTPGRELTLGPSEFVVCGAVEPAQSRTCAGADSAASIVIDIPRVRLQALAKHLDRLIGQPLSSEQGIGAVLRAYVVGLVDRLQVCPPADAIRLAAITLDLLHAVVEHHVDAQDAPSLQVQQLLRSRIDVFINRNLANPELSPSLIAAEHQVSLRYLYKLFQDQELSVAATIRRLRLERCRVGLTAPSCRARSIRSVSAQWGFADPAQFSRAFRQAYGVSPSDHRRSAVRSTGKACTNKQGLCTVSGSLADEKIVRSTDIH